MARALRIMGQERAMVNRILKEGGAQSILRGGASLAAIGANTVVTSLAVGKTTINFRIAEAGWLQALSIQFGAFTGSTSLLTVSQIVLNNDPLISDNLPISMFGGTAFATPQFANFVEVADILTIEINNLTGGVVPDVTAGWTVAPRPGTGAIVGSAIRPQFQGNGFRTLVAIGAPEAVGGGALTIPAGGILPVIFVIKERGVLDNLVIDAEDEEVTQVVGTTYDNKNLQTGILPTGLFDVSNTRIPKYGIPVNVAHELTVRLQNSDIVPRTVALAYTVR